MNTFGEWLLLFILCLSCLVLGVLLSIDSEISWEYSENLRMEAIMKCNDVNSFPAKIGYTSTTCENGIEFRIRGE